MAKVQHAREPMSKVDTAWLRMESPTNLMMITSVLTFAGRLDIDKLKRLIASRFLAFRRFRQKAVDADGGAWWETDRHFDIDRHVVRASLPGRRRDKHALERFVSRLASTPLSPARPLWQFHLLDGPEGDSVVVSRIHHCYADGLALVQVMLSLTDAAEQVHSGYASKAVPSGRGAARLQRHVELAKVWKPNDQGSALERLLQPARAGLAKAIEFGGQALSKGSALIRDPLAAATIARESGEITRELAVALSLADDPPTAFKGPLGPDKQCAWAEPLPLDEVKAIGRVLGCTVNDVLLACASGALRSYLRAIGEDVDGVTIRATVPVNLRPLEHAKKLGNHFGLVFLDLPIGESNPLRRLERVAASMRELKRSRQAVLTFGLLAAVGMAPASIQRLALDHFSRKATAVATNVPGPQMPLYLAGCEITEMMFWVPQNGTIGMGLSILSYNGRVHFGIITDRQRVADPEPIVERFAREVEKLTLITLMEEWDGAIDARGAEEMMRRYA